MSNPTKSLRLENFYNLGTEYERELKGRSNELTNENYLRSKILVLINLVIINRFCKIRLTKTG